MKKLAIIVTVALILCLVYAHAEGNPTQMRIVNCDDWVSLREDADIHSERLVKVPLGEIVDVYSLECIFRCASRICTAK